MSTEQKIFLHIFEIFFVFRFRVVFVSFARSDPTAGWFIVKLFIFLFFPFLLIKLCSNFLAALSKKKKIMLGHGRPRDARTLHPSPPHYYTKSNHRDR